MLEWLFFLTLLNDVYKLDRLVNVWIKLPDFLLNLSSTKRNLHSDIYTKYYIITELSILLDMTLHSNHSKRSKKSATISMKNFVSDLSAHESYHNSHQASANAEKLEEM